MNQNIPEIARNILGVEKLPPHLVTPLNTMFIKTFNKFDKGPYSSIIVRNCNNTGWVMPTEYANLVYNALILNYLMPKPSDARDLIVNLIKKEPFDKGIKKLRIRAENNFPLFFCFGIVEENISNIISVLNDTDFSVSTDKLPNPFKRDTLEPLTWDIDKFNWSEISKKYHRALEFIGNESLEDARKTLISVRELTLMRVPVVDDLLAQIERKVTEAEEVFAYLQKNL